MKGSALTPAVSMIMYMLMFSGAIALRYRMKKAGRPFRIGKSGNGLMWFIGGLGFCGSLLAFVLSFIPPSQISTYHFGLGAIAQQKRRQQN